MLLLSNQKCQQRQKENTVCYFILTIGDQKQKVLSEFDLLSMPDNEFMVDPQFPIADTAVRVHACEVV